MYTNNVVLPRSSWDTDRTIPHRRSPRSLARSHNRHWRTLSEGGSIATKHHIDITTIRRDMTWRHRTTSHCTGCRLVNHIYLVTYKSCVYRCVCGGGRRVHTRINFVVCVHTHIHVFTSFAQLEIHCYSLLFILLLFLYVFKKFTFSSFNHFRESLKIWNTILF